MKAASSSSSVNNVTNTLRAAMKMQSGSSDDLNEPLMQFVFDLDADS